MSSPAQPEHFDIVCLGGGEAAKYLTWQLGAEGKRCAVVEQKWIGGSCPNVACLPSKHVIHSAKKASLIGEARESGILSGLGENGNDMRTVIRAKQDMVDGDVAVHETLWEKSGVVLVRGTGKFVGEKMIEVLDASGNKRTLKGNIVVVCTGSRSTIPDVPGLKEAVPLTHVELLNLDVVPNHLIILGAGFMALEFAQAMRRFGAAVTIICRQSRILPREDEHVAMVLQDVLEKEGISISTSTLPVSVTGRSGDGVTVKATRNGSAMEIQGSHIFCATGRVPNTDNIGLDAAGIQLDAQKHILVDDFCRVRNKSGVFAGGDCSGSPYFTHAGHDDFRIVRDCIHGAEKSGSGRSNRQIPFTLFTDPEFAHVGLRENEAKAQGIAYRLLTLPIAYFNRAVTLGETAGTVKALISANDDLILGFSAVGPGAGELLPVVQLAMAKGHGYSDIADLIISHPTMNEGLGALFGGFATVSPLPESR